MATSCPKTQPFLFFKQGPKYITMKVSKQRKYSKRQVDVAGDVLINDKSSPEKKNDALDILSYWRACHIYPMNIFKRRLKEKSESLDKKSLTAQRLKRVPSIINKLKRRYDGREPTMKLSQMQDISGCRTVLSNVKLARELYEKYYVADDLKHKKIRVKDYIEFPKKDGYRSIHIIYRYNSDKGKKEYNGLLIEVQIRSKLQHLWATAVETVDLFTGQAIKSNEGKEEWVDLFRLVSSAFAKIEKCPIVPNTSYDEKELYMEIKRRVAELNVIKKMKAWTKAIKVFGESQRGINNKTKYHFFLLELDSLEGKLRITGYTKKGEKKAIEQYIKAEKRAQERKQYGIVLVGTDKDLRKTYPNY